MYQFLLHFYHFLALKWGEDGIMNYWKILQHHHILQGVFFSHLRVTKRYLSQDTTSQQPQNTCFHFLLWSTWVENMCFGLLRSCVLRQIPFCAPRVRKMSPWRMWWCWRVLQLLVILSWPHFKARKWWRWRRNWYIEQDNNNLQGVKRVGFI